MIVSIDPGDTVGVCTWTEAGVLISQKKMSLEDFIIWCDGMADSKLAEAMITVVVVEDFALWAHKAFSQRGSKMKASQGIGVAKSFARRVRAKLVTQSSSILKIAAMHTGTKVVQHFDDDVSAYLHGYWYFENAGILKSSVKHVD